MKCKLSGAWKKTAVILLGGVALLSTAPAQANDSVAQATTSGSGTAAHEPYSTNTALGVLLDDPKAHDVLQQLIPGMINNDQIDMARSMSLRQLQQYAGAVLTDEMLAKIDSELAKLNAAH